MANEPKQGIKQYLKCSEYPATTFDLITAAENTGAPVEIVDRLNQLPNDAEFSEPNPGCRAVKEHRGVGFPTPEHEVA